MDTNMKKIRKEYKYTQKYVAQYIGCTERIYREYEKDNDKLIRTYELLKLKELYKDVSTDYLLGLTNFRSPEDEYIGKQTGLSDEAVKNLRTLKFQDAFKNRLLVGDGHANKNILDTYKLPLINALLTSKHLFELLTALHNYAIPTEGDAIFYKTKTGTLKRIPTDNTIYLVPDPKHPNDNKQLQIDQLNNKSVYKNKLDILLSDFANEYSKQMRKLLNISPDPKRSDKKRVL